MNTYITPAQLADNLNISIKTVYDWVFYRKIPYLKIGKLVRFKDTEIEKWLKEKERKLPN